MGARNTRNSVIAICGLGSFVAAACGAGSDASNATGSDRPAVETAPGPLLAAGGGTSFVSFAHTCAVVEGHLQCWGADANGQLGDGFATVRNPLPTRVSSATGLDGGVTAIAAGRAHSCAIRSGRAWCWGKNDRRQIAADRPALFVEPVEIAGLPGVVDAIAAGAEHNCAIAGGRLFCWGLGSNGELGRDISERCGGYRAAQHCSATPLAVGALAAVTQVALGDGHGCAIDAGRVYCWGRNERGQLGDATQTGRAEPAKVAGLSDVTAISAGAAHSCASTGDGVFCWGSNDRGQLGDTTRTDRSSPVAVAGLAGAAHLAAGAAHSCAISNGNLACWGANDDGQLGHSGPDRDSPAWVDGLSGVSGLAAGPDHTCAVSAGRVLCFGSNDFGQLGRGQISHRSAQPMPIAAWDRGAIRDRNGDGRIVIACLGDSNTQAGFRMENTWCERLERELGDPNWMTVNRGWSGATAIALPSLRRAQEQLAYTLEFDAPDVVILAYGTNDLLQDATPEDVLMATLRLLLRARESGVDTFVALVPPAQHKPDEFDAAVESTNALLQQAIRPDRIIDFFSNFTPDDYGDEVHLNETGHAKRARAARAALQ